MRSGFRKRSPVWILWLGLALAASGATRASTDCVTELIVFGDSLSDNGNLYAAAEVPPSPPYFEGRFSNGPVWVEVLAYRLGLAEDDLRIFAMGGAKTGTGNFAVPGFPGVLSQIDAFVSESPGIDSDALLVIWAGANDFFDGMEDPAGTIVEAVTNIATGVATLAAAGGRRFFVPNLPDLGSTPEFLAGDPVVAAGATQLTRAFNEALAATLDDLEPQLGVTIVRFDVFARFEEFRAEPEAFGLTNVTAPCLQLDPFSVCDAPDENLFWDGVHPSAAGHGLLADAAYGEIEWLCALLNEFHRGDPDDNGHSDIRDVLRILDVLFTGRPRTACMESADVNDDGRVDLIDVAHLMGWLLRIPAVPPPAPPGPPGPGAVCGPDPADSPAHLGCVSYTSCP